MQARWIAMQEQHLSAVIAIAEVVHPNYPERPEVLADRLTVFPQGCFMAQGADGAFLGYTLSHPGVLLRPPPLDSLLERIPAGADCLYLHDIALLPAARGLGLGASLVAGLDRLGRELAIGPLALTAVNGSVPFWLRQGFTVLEPDSLLAEKLASYDADAAYMVRPVSVA
ncbi:GNAT family N-acetyltransferase [Insolitispirillum peregrinum]|uniref:Acetyltransferase (GNAT) family protein n=1 Tax=Insolitispirillum peregrinum TaxID=80876 RepID=A0A1N7IK22_9PROT|nr:GNAT family N-acetyltransferase [Insolitispirillum peregrinum]SIS37454.1 Acetyltransferase (GNAT) family protein [Insolitispirillum peregrinum]